MKSFTQSLCICSSLLGLFVPDLGAQPPQDGAAPAYPLVTAGEIWIDYNGDGLLDLHHLDPVKGDRLLQNRGNGLFEDVTAQANLLSDHGSRKAAWADFDRDGYPDLFAIPPHGPGRLLRNTGTGNFEDVTNARGIVGSAVDIDALWLDYDQDNRLDLRIIGVDSTSLYRNDHTGVFVRVELPTPSRNTDEVPAPGVIGDSSEERNRLSDGEPPSDTHSETPRTTDHGSRRTVVTVPSPTTEESAPGSRAGSSGTFPPGFSSICAGAIKDEDTGDCLTASVAPKLGNLYPLSEDWYVSPSGNVGLGTTNPLRPLHISSALGEGLSLEPGSSPNSGYLRFGDNTGWKFHFARSRESNGGSLNTGNTGALVTLTDSGYLGIGTTTPYMPLHVQGNSYLVGTVNLPDTGSTSSVLDLRSENGDFSQIYSENYGSNLNRLVIRTGDDGEADYLSIRNVHWSQGTKEVVSVKRDTITLDGNVGIGTSNPTSKLQVIGETSTSCLKITGGCDIAEPFDIAGVGVQPGMVVSIDPMNAGALRIATDPYDTMVAGIVSGAGGINVGMTLSQEGLLDGAHPVALTGRVYCWCDAAHGAIQPGDLLTTSSTPGFAMKATDLELRANATIGKALSSLDQGQGLVMVLVTLR